MNAQASSMGLQNSHFETPAGLDTPGNYSSARDLATMAHAALKYPLFAELVATKDATISTQNRQIEIHNTNQLLTTYPKATGVKTGTTPQSGANLVASAKDGDESYIAVVLGDDDRFADARTVLEYGFNRYEREPLVRQDEVYEELSPPYRRGESVELVAAEDVAAPIDSSSEVERQVTTGEPPPKAEAGQELGEVEVFVDGQSVGRSPLLAQEGYEEASLFQKAWYSIRGLLDTVWSWVVGIL
jgi:D-alanyl-D-alanine carboxypeptidase (penicillin-binding protein 5/6)